MDHPILEGSGYKYYGIAWAILLIAHAFVLYSYYDLTWQASVVDSSVYNISFCGLGLGFWYIVRYVEPDKDDLLKVIWPHLFASLSSILLWMGVGYYAARSLLPEDERYLFFLSEATVVRATIGIGFYILIVLVYYLIHYYQDLQTRISNEHELKNLVKDTELRALKSQINPHFIFNSLNSVSALTVAAPERAREMVIKLSDFLRFSLGSTEKDSTSLEAEIANAELYLDIEKIRFGDKLVFDKVIEPGCLGLTVPSMVLQPLLENAIKYGVSESLEPVTIQMSCLLSEDLLTIQITNNFEADAVPKKGEGIGLKNIAERLNLMFGSAGRILIDKQPEYFVVALKIPQNKFIDEH